MIERPLASWIDGIEGDQIPADDRGLAYGDGLFETILLRAGLPRFLTAHLERLTRGCEKLGIAFESALLRAEIGRAAALAPPLAVLKIIVTRGSAVRRGYRPTGAEHARRLLTLWESAPVSPGALERGVELRLAETRLGENPALAGLKHLNRLENVLAARECTDPRWFDAVMLDSAGRMISGTMSNVFVLRGHTLLTPRVVRCGVAGILRAVVLREAAHVGLDAREQDLDPGEVVVADGVCVTNARVGVVPVQRLGEHSIPMTDHWRRLREHVEALDA
jgi:4-amino-4-deoxychorismate lyase